MTSIQQATIETLSAFLNERWRRSFVETVGTNIDIPLGIGPDDEICPLIRRGKGDPKDQAVLTHARPRENHSDTESRFTVDMIEGLPDQPGIGYIEYAIDESLEGSTINSGAPPLFEGVLPLNFIIHTPKRSTESLVYLYAGALIDVQRGKRFGTEVWELIWPNGNTTNRRGINLMDQLREPTGLERLKTEDGDPFDMSLLTVKWDQRFWGTATSQ